MDGANFTHSADFDVRRWTELADTKSKREQTDITREEFIARLNTVSPSVRMD